jgi:hypothetical protein
LLNAAVPGTGRGVHGILAVAMARLKRALVPHLIGQSGVPLPSLF